MVYYGTTDVGKKRTANQDTFMIKEYPGDVTLAVVCDGMGGANGGATASSLAVSTFVDHIDEYADVLAGMSPEPEGTRDNAISIPAVLENAVSAANLAVYAMSVSDPELNGMGTTLVSVLATDKYVFAVNVGDSRMYLIDKNGIRQITRDHSYVQHLIDLGRLSPRKARTARNKNIITRAVGTEETVRADVFRIERKPSDDGGPTYALLCTDGLTNMAEPEEIAAIVALEESADSDSLKEAAERLIQLANDRGGADNITAVILAY
ncbi:MAG: Stp1/IreP family PP2C-type Ser/Thr phosphatase [Clostridia bacterium]|nr:Stp1/IreP family PP2C-type Ser/Thr phosphatase [Clostridia bacterium]